MHGLLFYCASFYAKCCRKMKKKIKMQENCLIYTCPSLSFYPQNLGKGDIMLLRARSWGMLKSSDLMRTRTSALYLRFGLLSIPQNKEHHDFTFSVQKLVERQVCIYFFLYSFCQPFGIGGSKWGKGDLACVANLQFTDSY